MKVIALMGSPKSKGNTAKMLSILEDKIGAEHSIETINITDYRISGCIGCNKCQKETDAPACIQKDDGQIIFEKILQADAIVYATPLYCWSFTSQLKQLIDRHYCLATGYGTSDFKSLLDGKLSALLVTCAGPIEGNCDAIQRIYAGIAEFFKLEARGAFILPFCTTPDAIGDEGGELAGRLVRAITE